MGIKKFLLPDELYTLVDFFTENNYASLDMNIVFNIDGKDTLQRISDHIFYTNMCELPPAFHEAYHRNLLSVSIHVPYFRQRFCLMQQLHQSYYIIFL